MALTIWSFFERDWRGNRDLFRVKRASLTTDDEPGEREIVILHGWHSLYRPMGALETAMRERFPEARIWRAAYDSHWKTFARSARDLNALLRRRGVNPRQTLLVGYSMGGLVVRSMVAQGFDARAVLCIASPHRGAVGWLPIGDVGSLSMFPLSPFLITLNRDPEDKKRRPDYFFQAFSFSDATGFCRHDRIVPLHSAVGRGLKGVGERHVTHLKYKGIAPGAHPHIQGMNPQHLEEAFAWCEKKLA